jgi:hypothetical protein
MKIGAFCVRFTNTVCGIGVRWQSLWGIVGRGHSVRSDGGVGSIQGSLGLFGRLRKRKDWSAWSRFMENTLGLELQLNLEEEVIPNADTITTI